MKNIIILFVLILSASSLYSKTTEFGTPRHETIIMDPINGKQNNPQMYNVLAPGWPSSAGYHQVGIDHLWDVNTATGARISSLAKSLPEQLNDDYTKWRISLRDGIYWSDGVQLTADDFVYTINLNLENSKTSSHGWYKSLFKKVEKVSKLVFDVEMTKPQPRITKQIGVDVWGNNLRVVPKHIFEKQDDPLKFKHYPPVVTGQYTLKDADPNGYWFIWELRDDWHRSPAGILGGKPDAKYLIWHAVGTEEKRILAMANNEMDILCDISPEAWDILRSKSKYAKAWSDNFPWANMDDPCTRGIVFNNEKSPYDKWQVRWALALAVDIDKASMGTFSGMLRVSPLSATPVSLVQKYYHKPLLPWLKEYTLPDGYKPFNDGFGKRMVDKLSKQGVEGLPFNDEAAVDLFGVGWWKYDPQKATALLESVGFKKNGKKWMLPDGKPWKMTINAPAGYEVESERLAYVIAKQWKKFGVDTNVRAMDGGSFWSAYNNGDFDGGSYWPGCAAEPDNMWRAWSWHSKHAKPTGTSSENPLRYTNSDMDELLDEWFTVPSDDPRILSIGTKIQKLLVEDKPWLPMFGTSKFVPVDTYYWSNYPSAKTPYEGPWWWWSNFKFMVTEIKATGRK